MRVVNASVKVQREVISECRSKSVARNEADRLVLRAAKQLYKTRWEAGVYRAMDQWSEIRRRVLTKELSQRQACEQYGIHWKTLQKMLHYSEPPGYRRQAARPRPKLDPYLDHIQQILALDKQEPVKKRHSARRIYQRLKADALHFYAGVYTPALCQ